MDVMNIMSILYIIIFGLLALSLFAKIIIDSISINRIKKELTTRRIYHKDGIKVLQNRALTNTPKNTHILR